MLKDLDSLEDLDSRGKLGDPVAAAAGSHGGLGLAGDVDGGLGLAVGGLALGGLALDGLTVSRSL